MNILISGFEPFGPHALNPSAEVVQCLKNIPLDGIKLSTVLLPVDTQIAVGVLMEAVQREQPQAVLCLGEAARRSAVSIERVGLNLLDFNMPDNRGNQLRDQPVRRGGPVAYFSTLPVRLIHESLLREGIPAELSVTAGTYLCNQVLYALLDSIAVQDLPIQAGFIHLPSLPEAVAADCSPIPSMSLETSVKAVRLALQVMGGKITG